jgi:hypothetical protein
MKVFRRYHSFIAAVVLACVSMQVLDLGLCCNVSPPATAQTDNTSWVSVTDSVSTLPQAASVSDALSASEEARSAEVQPDCFCHLVFTTGDLAPAPLHAVLFPSSRPETPELLRSVVLSPPGHIPLA